MTQNNNMTHQRNTIIHDKQPEEQFEQQVTSNCHFASMAIAAFVLLYLLVDIHNGDECWEVPKDDKFFEAMTHREPVSFKNPNILRNPDRYRTTIWQALEQEKQMGKLEHGDQEATRLVIKRLFDQMMKPRLVRRVRKAEGRFSHNIKNGFLDRDIVQTNRTTERIDMDKVCILIKRVDTSKEKVDFSISFDVIDRL